MPLDEATFQCVVIGLLMVILFSIPPSRPRCTRRKPPGEGKPPVDSRRLESKR